MIRRIQQMTDGLTVGRDVICFFDHDSAGADFGGVGLGENFSHQILAASNIRADNGESAGHSFQKCHRKAFLIGGEEEDICCLQDFQHILPVSGEGDHMGDSQLFGQLVKLFFQFAVAAEQVMNLRHVF